MTDLQVYIRTMQREDLAQVVAIESASFASPWTLGAFEDELRRKIGLARVACRAPLRPRSEQAQASREQTEQTHGVCDVESESSGLCPRESGAAEPPASSRNVLGYLIGWHVADEMHLLNIATLPEARRQGVAASLVEDLMREAWKRDCSVVTLEVRRSNVPAIKLYEKFGFFTVGIRARYYSPDSSDSPWEDALVMLCSPGPSSDADVTAKS